MIRLNLKTWGEPRNPPINRNAYGRAWHRLTWALQHAKNEAARVQKRARRRLARDGYGCPF